MFLTFWCLLTLVLAAVPMGATFAPSFDLREREGSTASQWLLVHSLYRRSSGIATALESVSILAAAVMTVLLRDWRPALLAALAGTACLMVGYAVFWSITNRANLQIVQWLPQAPPANWASWRRQWIVSQRARFGLHLTGFALLTLATLVSPLTQD